MLFASFHILEAVTNGGCHQYNPSQNESACIYRASTILLARSALQEIKLTMFPCPSKICYMEEKIAFIYKEMNKKDKRLSRFNMIKGSYS